MSTDVVLVKMAEMATVENSALLKTTLGSCVGVVLHDPRKKVSGLAHILLPERLRHYGVVGKYADTAIPALLSQLRSSGCSHRDIRAFVTGGANMFRYSGDGKIATIGDRNVEAAKRVLQELKIPVSYEDTGGDQGRTVTFVNHSGDIQVRTLNRVAWKGTAK